MLGYTVKKYVYEVIGMEDDQILKWIELMVAFFAAGLGSLILVSEFSKPKK